MKRAVFGWVLLAALLLSALTGGVLMDRLHRPVVQALEDAQLAARQGSWEEAQDHSRQALAAWQKWQRLRSCFADHTPTEDIEADFAQLAVYGAYREPVGYCALCASLARQVEAVAQVHSLVWWNFL